MIARGAAVLYPWAMAMVAKWRAVEGVARGWMVVCVGFFAASSGSTHNHLYQGNSEQVLDASRDPGGGIAPAKMAITA